ncbi:LuxR C-terminal-related transcriptional regulator [Klenkia brasiliensis]|uniref:LuxR C-terminal-related transcriptional regulator n=1 Tax=Klenkia brasiliensis TaxID=333142 RepID=UPI003BF94490
MLRLVAQGTPNRAIAASLFVSEATVTTRLGHVQQARRRRPRRGRGHRLPARHPALTRDRVQQVGAGGGQ